MVWFHLHFWFSEGVGKTSIILSLLDDKFCDLVPPRIETILIPPDVTPDGVVTEIIDYSAREQSEEDLVALVHRSNVICVVYSVDDQKTADRVSGSCAGKHQLKRNFAAGDNPLASSHPNHTRAGMARKTCATGGQQVGQGERQL